MSQDVLTKSFVKKMSKCFVFSVISELGEFVTINVALDIKSPTRSKCNESLALEKKIFYLVQLFSLPFCSAMNCFF